MHRCIEQNALVLRDEQNGVLLRIEETALPGRLVLALHGDVPAELAPDMEDELLAAALACSDLTLDLNGAGFLCAPALRAILAARQTLVSRSGVLRVVGARGPALQKMRDTGLDILLRPVQDA